MNNYIKDPIYGPKFKELRNQANKSLIETAKNITSKSSLDRLEKGNDNLSFSKVIELLQRINIQPHEFLESKLPSKLLFLYYKPMLAYESNNTKELKRLANEYANNINQKSYNQIAFFQYAISCDLYQELTDEHIISDIYQKKLNNYFSDLSNGLMKTYSYFLAFNYF